MTSSSSFSSLSSFFFIACPHPAYCVQIYNVAIEENSKQNGYITKNQTHTRIVGKPTNENWTIYVVLHIHIYTHTLARFFGCVSLYVDFISSINYYIIIFRSVLDFHLIFFSADFFLCSICCSLFKINFHRIQ